MRIRARGDADCIANLLAFRARKGEYRPTPHGEGHPEMTDPRDWFGAGLAVMRSEQPGSSLLDESSRTGTMPWSADLSGEQP